MAFNSYYALENEFCDRLCGLSVLDCFNSNNMSVYAPPTWRRAAVCGPSALPIFENGKEHKVKVVCRQECTQLQSQIKLPCCWTHASIGRRGWAATCAIRKLERVRIRNDSYFSELHEGSVLRVDVFTPLTVSSCAYKYRLKLGVSIQQHQGSSRH